MFSMKRIAFDKQTKSFCLSAPKRGVVDLAFTIAQAADGLGTASALQPCPSGTVREKLYLNEAQRFDLAALIKSISPTREAGPERR